MPRIHLLPPQVITAIAAGEIAERPAVILKELLENSLDANAKTISIDIKGSGLELISVSDDGEGMSAEDLIVSIQRHATSKISSLADLENVDSFGFRGEALASIATAANLAIASKTPNQTAGHSISVENGCITNQQPVGKATGTTVVVTELFATLPARRKFLHHTKTEWQLITEVVTTTALSHPEVGFWLRHNQKVVVSLPAGQTLAQRITSLLGDGIASSLVPILFHQVPLKITGFLGKPHLARRTKQQFLYINHRPIISQSIARTIKHAYSSLIEARVEPFFVLNLEIAPGLIDVNVHPRKESVRFIDEAQILTLIAESIKNALHQTETTYDFGSYQSAEPLTLADSGQSHPTGINTSSSTGLERSDRTHSFSTSQLLKKIVEAWQLEPQTTQTILQIHRTYLAAQTTFGLILIDQHAAHERILFEQFKTAYETQLQKPNSETQSALTPPLVLTLTLSEAAHLETHLETFTELGFTIEPFGTTSFKITHVAPQFKDHDLTATLKDMLDDLIENKPLAGIDRATDRTLAYLACRHAIKAGDFLTTDQAQELIVKLAATPNHATCPHGRPTSITYTVQDLEHLFKRH